MKLSGKRKDGSAYHTSVTARTTRVRLYKDDDVSELDLAGIHEGAPAISIFESADEIPIRIANLADLAAVESLTNLSLSISADTDLTPLGHASKLEYLSLTLWDRRKLDTRWLAGLGKLSELSLGFHGAAPVVDVSVLRNVRDLSLSGIGNRRLDLPPKLSTLYLEQPRALEKLGGARLGKLTALAILDAPSLRTIDTKPFAGSRLEHLRLTNVPKLAKLEIVPLGKARKLRGLVLTGHAMRFVDLTPLAKLSSLVSLEIDGKDAPFVDEGSPIVSPALQRWNAEGMLQRQL